MVIYFHDLPSKNGDFCGYVSLPEVFLLGKTILSNDLDDGGTMDLESSKHHQTSSSQESLLESLRQAFGPHGFLPEVVECLHSQPQLPAAAAEQLKIQCLLSLRLAAAWETPSSVQKPMELVIQQKPAGLNCDDFFWSVSQCFYGWFR